MLSVFAITSQLYFIVYFSGYILTFPQELQLGAKEKFCLSVFNVSSDVSLTLNISCYGKEESFSLLQTGEYAQSCTEATVKIVCSISLGENSFLLEQTPFQNEIGIQEVTKVVFHVKYYRNSTKYISSPINVPSRKHAYTILTHLTPPPPPPPTHNPFPHLNHTFYIVKWGLQGYTLFLYVCSKT